MAGEAVTVVADGRVVFRNPAIRLDREPTEAGPAGTYLYTDEDATKPFPLPTAAGGPAPPYCLIGRIGSGEPFYVGARKSWTAKTSGRLFLGINDFHLADNGGEFTVRVTKPPTVQPVRFEEQVDEIATVHRPRKPKSGRSVFIFYVDGLRPDVVHEMTAMGHLPYIRKLFVDGGAWLENIFTVFPSDTITSNGTMWTGCFSDRHGLKGQVRFSRRTLASESYLEPLGPSRSSRLLSPQGMDRLIHQTQSAGIGLLQGQKAGERWRKTHATEVPPLYQRLRREGRDWATGVLPIMTEVPPILWSRSLVRHLPYFQIRKAWQCMDEANADYTLRNLLVRESPVTIVWLPETDTVSHKFSRGQFGMTRRTIARADRLIGRIVEELATQNRLQNTYFLLVSDHGHHGGRRRHLAHFDIANELFYQPRKRTKNGRWIGGGLGLSVRQHRSWHRHPGDKSTEFVFLDAGGDGAARIFLPRGHYHSGKWIGDSPQSASNGIRDLLRYRIADDLPLVNLIEFLAGWQSTDGNGRRQRPVDLVLAQLGENSVLIATYGRGQAVINRKRTTDGDWLYRYRVIRNLRSAENGQITFEVIDKPKTDPLGLTAVENVDFTRFRDEQFWLRVSVGTPYPDGVVALSRHLLWQKSLRFRETEFAPDIVVTAKRGWYFGTRSSPGTMHGYPFRDSMRATLFVSGPEIRRGARISKPSRLVDLTPTILELIGHEFDADEFDGRPIRGIYRAEKPADLASAARPVFWSDVDLQAWNAINYQPSKPYAHQPLSVNQPDSPLDLNNILHNIMTLGDVSVLRLADDLLLPFRGPSPGMADRVEQLEANMRRGGKDWAADVVRTLDLSGTSLADYSVTSTGNIKRVDHAIEWVQQRGKTVDAHVAKKVGRPLPGSRLLHGGIDTFQFAFWETYRFTQRLIAGLLDETIINSLEDGTDRAINYFHTQPAEIIVDP